MRINNPGGQGALDLNFLASSVGSVSALSFKAAIGSASAATAVRVTDPTIGFSQDYSLSAIGTALQADVTATAPASMNFNFARISFVGAGTSTYGFDDLAIASAAVAPPANDSVFQLAPESYHTIVPGVPDIRVMRDTTFLPIRPDYINVQRTGGLQGANMTISYAGAPQMELRNAANIPTSPVNFTIAAGGGTTPFPVKENIGIHQDNAGHYTGAFTLHNASNSADPDDNLTYNLWVYDPPNLVTNNSAALDTTAGAAAVTMQNPNGSTFLRSGAKVSSVSVPSMFSLSGIAANSTLPVNGSLNGSVSFNSTTALNGTYTGVLSTTMISSETLSSIVLTPYSETRSWNLSHTVTGHTGSGSAAVAASGSYVGLNSLSDAGHGTRASLLAGNAGAAGSTVSMFFTPGTDSPHDAFSPIGDVVNLTGTAGSVFAFDLSFTSADMIAGGITDGTPLTIYSDGSASWQLGTVGSAGTYHSVGDMTFSAFVTSLGRPISALDLGTVGYHYNGGGPGGDVWLIIDHNSNFQIGQIPEPCVGLIAVGSLAIGSMRRRRQR